MDRISYFSLHSTSANNIKWPNIYTLYLNIYTHHTHNKHDMWRLLPSSKTTVSHEVETSSETIHKHKKILVLSYLNLLYLDLDSKVLHLHINIRIRISTRPKLRLMIKLSTVEYKCHPNMKYKSLKYFFDVLRGF